VVLSPHSSNNLQQKNNSFSSPTNSGICQAPAICKFTKQIRIINLYFCDFWCVEELEGNNIQVTKKTLMAKIGPRIMGFT
jgi:hypothetical protein